MKALPKGFLGLFVFLLFLLLGVNLYLYRIGASNLLWVIKGVIKGHKGVTSSYIIKT